MFAYDVVTYPDKPFRQATPDRLATMAAWFGLDPAPVDQCRVLEVGCGAGGNLFPLADRFPNSRFYGFDLARQPIEQGMADVAALKLNNAKFEQLDIMQFPEEAGEFDYIIAHGFFSWVPPAVQEKLLALCEKHLSPNGVAYISYNTYPGGHFRNIWRDLMRFHTRGIEDPAEKLEQAQAAMNLLVNSVAQKDIEHSLAAEDWARFSNAGPNVLFHDDLADFFQSFYFEDFVARAGAFGMQYLAEATIPDMEPRGLAPQALDALAEARKQDTIVYEQYLDFLLFRRFRQTLLCRQSQRIIRADAPVNLRSFQFSSPSVEKPVDDPKAPADAAAFNSPHHHSNATSNNPAIVGIMRRLIAAWPNTLTFDETVEGFEAAAATPMLKALTTSGLIDVSMERRAMPLTPGNKPEIWRVSRHQATRQKDLTTLFHGVVEVTEPGSRQGMQLIDGTRTMAELTQKFGPALKTNLEHLAKAGILAR